MRIYIFSSYICVYMYFIYILYSVYIYIFVDWGSAARREQDGAVVNEVRIGDWMEVPENRFKESA